MNLQRLWEVIDRIKNREKYDICLGIKRDDGLEELILFREEDLTCFEEYKSIQIEDII